MRYHTGTLRLTSGPLRIASKNKWALDKRVVRRRSAQREPVGLHLENKMQVPTMRREWEYFNECQYVQNWTLIGESNTVKVTRSQISDVRSRSGWHRSFRSFRVCLHLYSNSKLSVKNARVAKATERLVNRSNLVAISSHRVRRDSGTPQPSESPL